MRRRDFIALFGCVTTIAWTKSARTQPGIPLIGFLSSGTEQAFAPNVAGFISGLKETGYIIGQNVAVEYRWAESQYERLSTMANELARRPIALLVASGGTAVVRAAQGATRKIPIVFATADDPVANGLVSSLNHPGENITGVALLSTELSAKRIGLVRELVPQTKTIALLANRDNPENVHDIRDAQDAANSVGVKVLVLNAATEQDIDSAFRTIVQERAGALIVGTDPFYYIRKDQIITLATRNAVPTIYFLRDFVVAGGLMSYGSDFPNAYRQLGTYTGRILKGEKPGDLPILQPTKFELVVNTKTAKSLGLSIPPAVLAIADEVIE
jgi:putative tryptophan/tyrosine transport system substrate-binding protein